MSAIHSDISNRVDVKRLRDKREMPLCVIALIFSFVVFALLTYLAFSTAENPKIIDIANEFVEDLGITEITEEFIEDLNVEEVIHKLLLKIGALFVLAVLAIVLIVTYLRVIRNVGETVSCDIPVTDRQFPYLKEKCSAYAQRLGLDHVPELYISQEGSAEVVTSSVRFRSEDYIRLNCDYVRVAAEDEDFSPIDFMIASELAHIALDHRNVLWILLTVPARIIPFYQSLMFRAMCYSADRVAAALVGTKEAINAITVLSNSPDISAEFNREAYRSDIMEKKPWIDNAARIYYNFISDTPIPAYRIAALMNSEKESDVLS